VHMASYAPLFARIDGWQWTPDLIWFDNLHSYGTPNYYVQKLFSTNRGTQVVSALSAGKPLAGQDSLYASAVIDSSTHELILKVVNSSPEAKQICFDLVGKRQLVSTAIVTTLSAPSLEDENSINAPLQVQPDVQSLPIKGKKINITVKPASLTVIRATTK
jgi:alpha-N-arabinofuranosidase